MIQVNIKSNIDQVLKLYKGVEKAIPKALNDGVVTLYDYIGQQATGKHMKVHTLNSSQQKTGIRTAGRNSTNTLRVVTGRLARSILRVYNFNQGGDGSNESYFKAMKTGDYGFKILIGSQVPYALIHEKGGTINHNNLFGRGISASIKIPKRPYMEPASKDGEKKASPIFDQALQLAAKGLK